MPTTPQIAAHARDKQFGRNEPNSGPFPSESARGFVPRRYRPVPRQQAQIPQYPVSVHRRTRAGDHFLPLPRTRRGG
jgi:hypothetical protein